MKLHRILIKNFKSIPVEGVELEFRKGFLALVGKNNAGKSNIVEAIAIVLGPKAPLYTPIDKAMFNDPMAAMLIEVELSGVTYGEGMQCGLSKVQCAVLHKESKKGPANHLLMRLEVPACGNEEEDIEQEDGAEEEGEAKESKKAFSFLVANHHGIFRSEKIRQRLVKLITVPATRNCTDMLAPSTWTSYGRMVHAILEDSKKIDDLRTMIENATASLKGILESEAKTLTKSAKSTAYVDSIDFRLTKDGNPSELLRNLSLAVTYGDRTEDVSESGTGTQSAVIIGVLELCLRHKSKTGFRLFIIEEPELFLHPHAQRHVAALLRKIGEESNTQVIITTHSGAILAETNMLDVVKVDRGANRATRTLRIDESKVTDVPDWERTLTSETCEAFFADRAVLVEGPSEKILLPKIARLVKDADGKTSCDPDQNNVSFVNVGGKERFQLMTDLLDEIKVEWAIITDNDAISGDTLKEYKKRAGVEGSANVEEQRKKLRDVGVVALSQGEIEDYYSKEFLAGLGGCGVDEVEQSIESRRCEYEDVTAQKLVTLIITEHKDDIGQVTAEKLPKQIQKWYSKTVQALQASGDVGTTRRKTGDVLAKWLKRSKPEIAQQFAEWLQTDSKRIPAKLVHLVRWAVLKSLPPAPPELQENSDSSPAEALAQPVTK